MALLTTPRQRSNGEQGVGRGRPPSDPMSGCNGLAIHSFSFPPPPQSSPEEMSLLVGVEVGVGESERETSM